VPVVSCTKLPSHCALLHTLLTVNAAVTSCHIEQEHGIKPKVQGQGTVAQSAATAASSSSRPHTAGRASSSQQQQQQQQQRRSTPPQAAPVSAQLKPATEFSPFTAVIGTWRRKMWCNCSSGLLASKDLRQT
jgi:hypothetical protein